MHPEALVRWGAHFLLLIIIIMQRFMRRVSVIRMPNQSIDRSFICLKWAMNSKNNTTQAYNMNNFQAGHSFGWERWNCRTGHCRTGHWHWLDIVRHCPVLQCPTLRSRPSMSSPAISDNPFGSLMSKLQQAEGVKLLGTRLVEYL